MKVGLILHEGRIYCKTVTLICITFNKVYLIKHQCVCYVGYQYTRGIICFRCIFFTVTLVFHYDNLSVTMVNHSSPVRFSLCVTEGSHSHRKLGKVWNFIHENVWEPWLPLSEKDKR